MTPERILVLEPKASLKNKVKRELSEYEVKFVKDGEEAIKTAQRWEPSIIVLDISIPDMNGYEIYGKLKAKEKTRDIPVLYLTTSEKPPKPEENVIQLSESGTLKQSIEKIGTESNAVKEFLAEYSAGLATSSAQELTEVEGKELSEAGFPMAAPPNFRPLAQRAAEYAKLIRSSLSTSAAAKRLGVKPSRIRQRLLGPRPSLYAIRKDHEWLLPAFQFEKKDLVPNIDKVMEALDRNLDAVAVFRWFHAPNPDLIHEDQEIAPLEWLRQGLDWKIVAELAENL